jgi:hypothetical protein
MMRAVLKDVVCTRISVDRPITFRPLPVGTGMTTLNDSAVDGALGRSPSDVHGLWPGTWGKFGTLGMFGKLPFHQ